MAMRFMVGSWGRETGTAPKLRPTVSPVVGLGGDLEISRAGDGGIARAADDRPGLRDYSRAVARLLDIALSLGIAAVGIADVAGGDLHPAGAWLAGAFVTAGVLLWRRRYPLMVVPGVLAPWFALSFTYPETDPTYAFFAVLVAIFTAAAYNELRPALLALGLVLAFFAVGAAVDSTSGASDVVFISFFVIGAWLLGRALRGRTRYASALEAHAERLEFDRDAQARAAVVVERARIARELHDVIAHSISVMVLQAGGVRRRLGDEQARERTALETVESTGREALGELRLLLGMLRAGDEPSDPQRGLAHIDELVASVRAAGLDVTLDVTGDPGSLPRALDLSAYRIVQEALTNVLKHAGAGQARVTVRRGLRRLELEIVDDGAGRAAANGDAGHGLVGMQERVAMFGGTFEAAARPEGGFAVHARLPIEAATG
jgi:signal transduction histidine kinase